MYTMSVEKQLCSFIIDLLLPLNEGSRPIEILSGLAIIKSSNAEATFAQSIRMQRFLKTI